MTRISSRVVAIVALAAIGLLTAEARAQTDAAPAAAPAPADAAGDKAKAKPKPKALVDVTVTNHRAVGLKELDAGGAGGPTKKKIVNKLAPGAKTVVKLGKGKDCLYDLHAVYDDGNSADISAVDICKDKAIDLVE
jgi:hypothetical protein